jgi:hypothetical protein
MKSFLLGDDIFISYARGDSSTYATSLANGLGERAFLCYIDQYGTDVGDELPESEWEQNVMMRVLNSHFIRNYELEPATDCRRKEFARAGLESNLLFNVL